MPDKFEPANVSWHLPVIELIPTFPIDENRVRSLKRQRIWGSPALIFGWVTAGICRTIHASGWISTEGELYRMTAQALARWNDQEDDLLLEVLRGLIDESNRSQDAEIQRLIHGIRQAGHAQYAISLSRFLLLKQHIEEQLHRDGKLTTRKREVEQLVDALFGEVCLLFQQLVHLKNELSEVLTSRNPDALTELTRRTNAGHERIMQAYATLFETSAQLGVLVSPGSARSEAPEEMAELDRLIEYLREENEDCADGR